MTLLLKLFLAPLLVVGSTLAGRRWGAQVAGLLVTLPIVAGPILLIICLERGVAFGARAASSSLLGLLSLDLFVVTFAWCCRRWGWFGSLLASWALTLAADAALARVTVPPWLSLLLVLTVGAFTFRALTVLGRGSVAVGPSGSPPGWDLPARAAATAVLVLAVTGAAASLGPNLTGVLAPFPIATSVVAAFVRAQQGPEATLRTMLGVSRGLFGFAVFCFLVAVLIRPVGVGAAFGLALAGTLLVQLGWFRWTRRARRGEDEAWPPSTTPNASGQSASGSPR